MKKFFILLLATSTLFMGLISVAYSQANDSAKGVAMCDRIQKQGICEEYRVNTLTSADKKIITKHCTSDALCPDQDRIGKCLKYKDPDDVIFDRHYYQNVAEKEDWEADFIEETCANNSGEYEAN